VQFVADSLIAHIAALPLFVNNSISIRQAVESESRVPYDEL